MFFHEYITLIFILLCLKTTSVLSSDDALTTALETSPQGQVNDDELVIKSWQKLRNELPIDLDSLSSGVSSHLDNIVKNSNVSSACGKSLFLLLEDARAKRTWAIRGNK